MKNQLAPTPATDPIDTEELRSRRRDLAPAPRVVLCLVHQEGVEVRELVAGEPIVVGREAPADLYIDDATLSRRHASFTLRPDREHVDVEDFASTNGTWRGDRRVERAVLTVGEDVMLGGVLARLRRLAAPRDDGPSHEGDARGTGGAGKGASTAIVAGPAFSSVLRAAERAANSRITILLQGETGTGKEVVARHIHASSPRAAGPMTCINCGAIPRELIESTFFGHERGAFTGAAKTQRGVFESASGGTVFLDEIGELPPAAQVALLRVLETGRITRVGGSEEVAVDVRVVAATHRDLAAMSQGQGFRSDLYFRLSALTLELPPLRERREDIEALARGLLREANRTHGRHIEGITADALRVLMAHDWPGNVRELRNVIERAAVLAGGDVIDIAELPERLRAAARAPVAAPPTESSPPDAAEPEAASGKLRERIQAYEAEMIRAALAAADGSRSEAARALNMPLRTLARRIKMLGIDEDDV